MIDSLIQSKTRKTLLFLAFTIALLAAFPIQHSYASIYEDGNNEYVVDGKVHVVEVPAWYIYTSYYASGNIEHRTFVGASTYFFLDENFYSDSEYTGRISRIDTCWANAHGPVYRFTYYEGTDSIKEMTYSKMGSPPDVYRFNADGTISSAELHGYLDGNRYVLDESRVFSYRYYGGSAAIMMATRQAVKYGVEWKNGCTTEYKTEERNTRRFDIKGRLSSETNTASSYLMVGDKYRLTSFTLQRILYDRRGGVMSSITIRSEYDPLTGKLIKLSVTGEKDRGRQADTSPVDVHGKIIDMRSSLSEKNIATVGEMARPVKAIRPR